MPINDVLGAGSVVSGASGAPSGFRDAVYGAVGGMSASEADWWQKKLTSIASGRDQYMPSGDTPPAVAEIINNLQSGQYANDPALTVVGQGEAWLTPDELRARTAALQGRIDGSTSGGGGGGGSSGGAAGGSAGTGTGTGGVLSGTGGTAPVGSTPGGIQQTTTPVNGTIPYQNPGSVTSNNTVGYINPGSTNGTGGQAGVLQMNPANPQSGLDQYKNTTGYQLLNTPGAYQASPGYQYAMDQAMNQVQNGASAHGMLESGAVLKSMQQTASGLAQQDYSNWWNRQNQLYGDYQNRLQGLAAGPTGSADAMTAGANQAQSNLQTGSNLGSLFGNQGTTGMGGIINTAAAQSGNIINAGQQQATVNAANQATQLAGATIGSNQNRGLF